MYDTDADDGRIAPESSPSCGYAGTAVMMGCPNAHTIDAGESDDEDAEVLEVSNTMRRDTSTTLEVAL